MKDDFIETFIHYWQNAFFMVFLFPFVFMLKTRLQHEENLIQ